MISQQEQPQPQCEQIDCTRPGHECSYNDNDTGVPDYYYCTEHAWQNGFCWNCGYFWGGVSSFECPSLYGGIEGLCENCSGDFRAELREDREDEEYGYGPEEYNYSPFEL